MSPPSSMFTLCRHIATDHPKETSKLTRYIHFHEPKLKTVQRLLNRERFKEQSRVGEQWLISVPGYVPLTCTFQIFFRYLIMQIPSGFLSEHLPQNCGPSGSWNYIYIYMHTYILSIIYFKLYYIGGG